MNRESFEEAFVELAKNVNGEDVTNEQLEKIASLIVLSMVETVIDKTPELDGMSKYVSQSIEQFNPNQRKDISLVFIIKFLNDVIAKYEVDYPTIRDFLLVCNESAFKATQDQRLYNAIPAGNA